MKQKQTTIRVSKEERTKIVLDYLQSDLSYEEIAKKYGIDRSDKIRVWCSRFRKSAEVTNSPKATANDANRHVNQKTPSYKKGEMTNGHLRKEVWALQLENKALNILIDLAEECGIDLKKKIWAQAVDILCEREGLDIDTACKLYGKSKLAWERAKENEHL